MIKILYIFSLILILLFPAFAQEEPLSIHELHKKEFGNLPLGKSLFNEDGRDIIPLQFERRQSASAVFGYLPYWEYKSAGSLIQYDLLTHLACFDFQADSLGNLKYPSSWPWTDVINLAHSSGVKVVICVTNFTPSQIKSIISYDSVKQKFFTNVKNVIQKYSLDGVNIDFENLDKTDRGFLINNFMKALTYTVHNAFAGKEVSFAGPAINWGGWDFPGLAKACDYIFIMGYDFYGKWSSTTGPCSPLTGGKYNLTSALTDSNFGYGNVVASDPQKLILGVPYFGNQWLVSSNSPYSKVVKHVAATFFRSEILDSKTYGLKWDSFSATPWYCFKQDTLWFQDWFDTDSSTALKYNLAASKNLKGIGMWALGQDGSRPEMWDLLRKRTLAKAESSVNPSKSDFALNQNYPNPFNPSTVINYKIPVASKVTLSVYDIMGREIAILVDGEKSPGTYSIRFDGSRFSSGVYFYRLVSGNLSIERKFILIK